MLKCLYILLGLYGKFSVIGELSPYVILGYSDIELDSNVSDPDNDSDFSYGVGIDFHISDKSAINVEYMSYYDDSGEGVSVEITAIGIGYTHKF